MDKSRVLAKPVIFKHVIYNVMNHVTEDSHPVSLKNIFSTWLRTTRRLYRSLKMAKLLYLVWETVLYMKPHISPNPPVPSWTEGISITVLLVIPLVRNILVTLCILVIANETAPPTNLPTGRGILETSRTLLKGVSLHEDRKYPH